MQSLTASPKSGFSWTYMCSKIWHNGGGGQFGVYTSFGKQVKANGATLRVFFFFFQFPFWFASVFSMLLYINIQNYSSNTKKRREKYCVAIIHCFSLYLLDNMRCPTRNCQFLMLISVLGISLMPGSRKARSFFYLIINKEQL